MPPRLTFASWLPACSSRTSSSRRSVWTTGGGGAADDFPRLSIRAFAPQTRRPPRRARPTVSLEGAAPTRIAVVGGGLAGLAVTYHLLHSTRRMAKKRGLDYREIRVTVFDPARPGQGGGTSVAAGLLHPFTPRVKKKAWHAKKGVPGALDLIAAAQPFADGDGDLVRRSGILRLGLSDRACEDFAVAARRYPGEVQFWDAARVAAACPALASGVPGAFLPQAVVVDTARYARALAAACDATGRVEWRWERVGDAHALLGMRAGGAAEAGDDDDGGGGGGGGGGAEAPFDAVVLAAGAALRGIAGLENVPLTACRGQNVRLAATRRDTLVPPFPVMAGKYVVPDYFGGRAAPAASDGSGPLPAMFAGATFEYCPEGMIERDFAAAAEPDLRAARAELADPIRALIPGWEHYWAADAAAAGVRALPPRSPLGSIPLAARLQGVPGDRSAWVLAGLGSRGLLHHAYLGKLVAQAVVAGNERLIPIDARRIQLKLGA